MEKITHARQSEKILALLRDARGAWVPLPEILELGIAQYNARIFELRKNGLNIENRMETIDGLRQSWFRLVESPAAPPPSTSAPESDYNARTRAVEAEAMPLFASVVRL